jgi:hypothetical protein
MRELDGEAELSQECAKHNERSNNLPQGVVHPWKEKRVTHSK